MRQCDKKWIGQHPLGDLLGLTALIGLSLALFSACSSGPTAATPTPARAPTEQAPATVTAPPVTPTEAGIDLAPIETAWEGSPHGNTYDLGKGPNTFCARCHSPENWDPAAKPDAPPNCVSCKFPFDAEVRVAPSNPLVPEADWKDIGCVVCHATDDGSVKPDIAWYDTVTGYHETVTSTTELCEKCHTDTETIRHRRDLGQAAHAGFTCTDCHDPHTTAASCGAAGCHETVGSETTAIPGHDADHAAVTCVACHDASGLDVGPAEGENVWITFRTTELLGRANTEAYQSHALQRSVMCERCHFADNPWGLTAPVATAEP
jgi:hypothetical protein